MIPRLVLVALLMASPAFAFDGTAILADSCGRTVTENVDGSYSAYDSDGTAITVTGKGGPGDIAGALNTLAAMASTSCLPTPVPRLSVITRAEFLARFTPADDPGLLKRIIAASRTSDDIAQWLEVARAQERIDLADPKTKFELDALVAAGLLNSARQTAILTP